MSYLIPLRLIQQNTEISHTLFRLFDYFTVTERKFLEKNMMSLSGKKSFLISSQNKWKQ